MKLIIVKRDEKIPENVVEVPFSDLEWKKDTEAIPYNQLRYWFHSNTDIIEAYNLKPSHTGIGIKELRKAYAIRTGLRFFTTDLSYGKPNALYYLLGFDKPDEWD